MTKKTQHGVTYIGVLIGVATVLLFLATVVWPQVRDENLRNRGKTFATSVQPYNAALFAYSLAYRIPLTSNSPTYTVTGVVNKFAPTCAELRAAVASLRDYSCSLPEGAGTPTFNITPTPTGCGSTACDLVYTIDTSAPIRNDDDGYAILQAAVNTYGAEAGQSIPGYASVIRGTGWQRANPLGNQVRTFGTYATIGSSVFAQFLTTYDIRDPNFINNVTIGGSTNIGGTLTVVNSIGSGTATGPTGGCQLAQLANAGGVGQILARASDCVVRVFADGGAGTVETRTATGLPSVRVGGDGSISTYSTTGRDAAGITYTASISTVYADNLRNTSATAGINVDGGVYGTSATFGSLTVAGNSNLIGGTTLGGTTTIARVEIVGTPCAIAGIFARQADGQLLACVGNLWQLSGLVRTTIGAPCTDGLALDINTPSSALFCRDGIYVSLNQSIGIAWFDSVTVTNGSVVNPLTCVAGAAPIVQLVPSQFQTVAAGGTVRYSVAGTGPWTISITGVAGAEAVAWRGCRPLVL